MNKRRTASRWAAWTLLAAMSAGLCVAVSAGAGDKTPPPSDQPPDAPSAIVIRIKAPDAGSAESIGDISVRTGTKSETLSPPYSKDLHELIEKLKAFAKDGARAADQVKPSVVIRADSDLKLKAVVRVMDACRKAGLTMQIEAIDAKSDSDLNYNVDRIENISVPGPVDPTKPIDIPPAPDGLRQNPSGIQPGGSDLRSVDPGGPAGIMEAGGFGGRSGATRLKLLRESGGNDASELAVARGLLWLAHHQAPDGHWSLDHFDRFYHYEPSPSGKIDPSNSENGTVNRMDDVAATGFALLPLLGAGHTQKPNKEDGQKDYSKTVKVGLDYLIAKQSKDGYFGGSMYSHGIATIAMCEAYGMTSDPALKGPAQKAIRFIENAQDPDGGGWRYAPRTPGDLSVTGWQVMALKSAQMAGLELANKGEALKKAEIFLDSVETANQGEYAYMPKAPGTPTMTAVGMLCRQYLGISPRNPGLLAGVDLLKKSPPGKANNIYYEYYAAQVMHHMGGEHWDFWNEGPDGKDSHTGIRDLLIARQQTTADKPEALAKLPGAAPALPAELAHEEGSWDPDGQWGKDGGGRIMYTSLSLLTLEVYYRHLPLYRSIKGEGKDK